MDIVTPEARWASDTDDGASFWYGEQAPARKLSVPKRLAERSTNEFIASTETEARDGDIIEQSSWRLTEYRRNPVVLDNHYGELVGRSEMVRVVDDELRALVLWDDSDENPRGQQVARYHRDGWRKAVSVRWITGERTARNRLDEDHPHYDKGKRVSGMFGDYLMVGDYLTRCTLLEISSVDIPSDPRALQTRFAKGVVRQVPDEAARADLLQALDEALRDGSLAQNKHFRSLVTDCLLTAARTEGEFRTVLEAIASDVGGSLPADEQPTIHDWLRPAFQ